MKAGSLKGLILLFILFFGHSSGVFSADKIESVPLINLEELSPTFEEDKDAFDQLEEQNSNLNLIENSEEKSVSKKNNKIYINLTALDKITAKTSNIDLFLGETKKFGLLEIKALQCGNVDSKSENEQAAYIQVKDLSDNLSNQIFVFNGWTFSSSTTVNPLDHPVYDLWLVDCDNV